MSTAAHDHPRAFVSAEYDHGHAGLEVRDAGGGGSGDGDGDGAEEGGGAWRGATVYTHRGAGNLVLWFGGDEYEGIGGSYCWCPGGRCAKSGTPCGPRLLDSDGDVVPTRATPPAKGGTGLPALPEGRAPVASARAVRTTKGAGRFLPFEEALVFVRSLRLKNQKEWVVWRMSGARAANIPSSPNTVYAHDGWQGMGHWLGTGTIATFNKVFLPFAEALVFVRSLHLRRQADWYAWRKTGACPTNIPSNPDRTYVHDGWQGWGHWLGTGAVASINRVYLPFEEALVFVRSLQLRGQAEWCAWRKSRARPANIPSNPNRAYQDHGWRGYGHWLGTGTVATFNRVYLPFEEALVFAHSLKLKSWAEWYAWSKSRARPTNIPSNPNRAYQDHGWQNIGHWLGNTNGQSRRARVAAHEPAVTARETSPCTSRKRSAATQATLSVRAKRPASRGLRD